MLLGFVVHCSLRKLRNKLETSHGCNILKQRRFDKVHGTTRAAFHATGKFPRVKEQLTIEVIIGLCEHVDLWTLRTCGLRGPVDSVNSVDSVDL